MAIEAFTIRAETEIVHKQDDLAGSHNYLVNQAIKKYLETHACQVEKITQGIAAVDRGELLVAHDDVMRELEDLMRG